MYHVYPVTFVYDQSTLKFSVEFSLYIHFRCIIMLGNAIQRYPRSRA